MRKITALQVQKRNPNRVNLYLDGEFAFGLSRMVAAWLKVGQTLDEEKLLKLQSEDTRERAMRQALLFLSYRARSEAEIRANLEKHDFPEAAVEVTLERLRQERLADDTQFAQVWVENRSTFRPRGRRALAVELRQKGLADSIIQSALQAVDEERLVYEAAQQKARKLRGRELKEFRKKLSEFLARRGFPYSLIPSTVNRIWDEMHATGEPHSIDNEEIA